MSEIYESEYAIWQLGRETCQIHHTTEIISRVDYWNEEWIQYSMNEFISPLMK